MKRKSLLIMLLAALFMPLALHAQQALPYEYSFENQDLTIDGWTTSNLIDGSEIMQLYNSGDNLYVFAFYYTTNPPQYLISPLLTGTENGVSVEFQYACYRTNWGDETFQVGYSTTTDAIDSFTWGTEITASNSLYDGDDWLTYENNFPAGTKYVAIKHTSYDRFYFLLDNFSFAAPDACPKPTGLTVDNITGHTATLNWNSTSGSTWQICINDDESHLITTSQNPYTLTGLNAETDYTVKVRTKCSNTDISNWTNNLAFTTDVACPAPGDLAATDITSTSANITWTGSASNYNLRYKNFIFIEDFESGSLNNWTTVRNGEGNEYTDWRVVNSENAFSSGSIPAHSGVYVAMSRSWSGDPYSVDNWLITPQVTLDGTLKFWVLDDGEYHEHFDVYVSTATNNINDFTLLYEPGDATDTWSEITVDLSSFGGVSGYIAIRNEDNDKDYLFIDDFVIYYPAVEWTTINNATSPCPISGLTPETAYQIQVQAVCGGQDGSSVWTSTSFTTLPSCVAPTDLTISNITTNSAVVTWTGSARSYNLKVNDQTYNNVTSPYTLSNLTAATIYTVEVQSVCSASSTSTWTSTEFITEFCEEADKCLLTFVLTDSYGDTWNGNGIAVVDAATNVIIDILTNDYDYHAETGEYAAQTQTKTLAVCNGRQLQFIWVKGNYPGEASWVITDVNGEEITSGTGSSDMQTGDILATYTVNCTVTSCRKPTDLTATEVEATSITVSWTENGEATSWKVAYGEIGAERLTTQTAYDTIYTITTGLEPEKAYIVKVRPVCDVNDKWSDEITVTTPALCPLPSDITIEAQPNSATLSWTGSVDSYNVRYRVSTVACFEDGTLGDWTTIDADGDGYDWIAINNGIPGYNESAGLATSASYSGNAALTPDNYLVSPQVTLGGSISFYACAQDADWAAEHFGVAISTTGNTDAADFTTIAEWTMNAAGTGTEGPARAQGAWGLFTVDLSDYAGQTGYVAIRHFDCTDMFRLNVDDITIIQPGVEVPWIATLSTTETTITLPNLQMGTIYEYQMQSVCGGTPTAWSASNFFVTLNGNVFITDGNWGDGNDWYSGSVPAEGSNVVIQANVTIPAGYTAVADQITIEEGGSLTIADGGQLIHNTDDLEVTMKKNVPGHDNAKSGEDGYMLLAFPFNDDVDVPTTMTAAEGNDFYTFDNSMLEQEWQNNKTVAINSVTAFEGYLYANPNNIELSLTGPTYACDETAQPEYILYPLDDNDSYSPGWRLYGNPFTCNSYIYTVIAVEEEGQIAPMEIMYYDENGEDMPIVGGGTVKMKIDTAGPVPPMQGFFVKLPDNIAIYYDENYSVYYSIIYFVSYDPSNAKGNIKSLPSHAISLDKKMKKANKTVTAVDKTAYKDVPAVEKKADKTLIVLDKTMEKMLAKKDAIARFKNEVMLLKPIKK